MSNKMNGINHNNNTEQSIYENVPVNEESAPIYDDVASDEEKEPYNHVPNEEISPGGNGNVASTQRGTGKGRKGPKPAVKPKPKEVKGAQINPDRQKLLPSKGHSPDLQPSKHTIRK